MLVKVHKTEDGRLLTAVCDTRLINKIYEEGIKQLDLTGDFYKGEEKTPSEAADFMRNSDMINIVGEESVKVAMKEELISSAQVKIIAGIPYAQNAVND